ncbi:hypothetical protein QO010_002518 [Caulobacter ginsengisoli]|uniref:PH domain-containing protein n=1 Tax=Caulobacter ginsengisoli TaxID=400775 RepID=A0ABU0IRX8_9CAUL|nr:hypothetical protein [Caulobacter ginsengisoli]MDQ0464734.1 hypothetical protein [Caulobacter ginsengisoli]
MMMGGVNRLARGAVPWLWAAAYLGLLSLVLGRTGTHTLITTIPKVFAVPIFAIGLGAVLLGNLLPRWRREEKPTRILWTMSLPTRIAQLIQGAFYPLCALPSYGTIQPWFQTESLLDVMVVSGLLGMTAALTWAHLRPALGDGVSVRVTADGLQIGGRRFVWSRIEAIESGYAALQDGAKVVLADRHILLTPQRHGPTGRALVAAVERFSPETTIREPEFQAAFNMAPG